MIALLYDKETGAICYKQWLNKPHNPEQIELIISELAPHFDKLQIGQVLYDENVKPESHKVVIEPDCIYIIPREEADLDKRPLNLRQLAIEAHRNRNTAQGAAMHGITRLVNVVPEARRCISGGRRGGPGSGRGLDARTRTSSAGGRRRGERQG